MLEEKEVTEGLAAYRRNVASYIDGKAKKWQRPPPGRSRKNSEPAERSSSPCSSMPSKSAQALRQSLVPLVCHGAGDGSTRAAIEYELIDVEKIRADYDEMIRLSGQRRTPLWSPDEGHVLPDFGPEELAVFLKKHSIAP